MNSIFETHLTAGIRSAPPYLQHALAHFAAIVESSDEAIISEDLDGRILSWNAAAQRLFGWTAEEAIGRPIHIVIPPDRLEEERRIVETVRDGGHIDQLETQRLNKDGRTVNVAVTISPVRDADGTIIGAAKIARGSTARSRAEERLRHSERALRQANEELRVRTEELARFNQAAVGREMRIIELKRELNDLLAEFGRDARYPLEFDQEPILRSVPSSALRESPVPLAAILRTDELDHRPARPPAYETETRALDDLMQILADSPRTILQALADKVLQVLRAGSSGLSLLTDTGEQFYWAAIAGAWQPHLGGGTPRDFGPCGDVLDCNAPLLFTHWEKRYPYLAEATPLAEEGLLVPFRIAGRTVGTIWAISHDPQRKFDREDLRLLERLGRFASVAYQAAELLGAVEQRRAALNLLEDAVHARESAEESSRKLHVREEGTSSEILSHLIGDDPRARLAIDVIKRQVAQLARLVDDLLDVARITQGRIRLRLKPIDLGSILAHAVEMIEPALHSKQHRILLTTSSPQPIYVEGDPTRLVQCVVNVLSNAVKYTDPGGEVRIQTRVQDSQVIIEISDTGVGIAPDLLPHVFDLFVQSDRSLDRAQGGLGIGLAVVKRLVEMHGGQVGAHSSGVGEGATFEIRLPRIAYQKSERAEPIPPKPAPRRVLVVDDNVDAAASLATLLTFQGHEAEAVYNGKDALKRVSAFDPDVVLLDIGLPEMDGYELAKRLRAMPQLEGVRLVALTGYGQADDRERAIAAGFDDHLVKPVDLPALERTLNGVSEPAGE